MMSPPSRLRRCLPVLSIFAITAGVYAVSTYGGIRSPDSEIVFRTAQSLAERGDFALQESLPLWEGFGAPVGRDGQRYSLFGPGQSVAAAFFLKPLLALNVTQLLRGRQVAVSHYAGDGLTHFLEGTAPASIEPHALRFLASFFNVAATAMLAALFFAWMRRLLDSTPAAVWTTVLLAFGTPIYPYAGTFFSEPLATLLLVASFALIAPAIVVGGQSLPGRACCLISGLCLGAATATHLSAILFAPFWPAYVVWKSRARAEPLSATLVRGGAWLAGLGLILTLLAWHNFHRFGSVFETGRTVDPAFTYGVFVAPWTGLQGLLWSSGKGLLWYCPAVVLGLTTWRTLFGRDRAFATLILAAAIFRLLFIACRSDWHGGFSLGPRYLVMLIPFLLISSGFWLRDLFERKSSTALLAVAFVVFLCIAQQVYFAMGEIFSFFHVIRIAGEEKGLNVFLDYYIYRDWGISPLFYLLDAHRGPWLLRQVPWGNYTLWALSLVPVAFAIAALYWRSLQWIRSGSVESIGNR
jgi:hypothetical protein